MRLLRTRRSDRIMDYDKTTIAASYDAARSYRPGVMRQWLDLIATQAPPRPQCIVDVGCGTGRFTQPLADRFEANAVGIDPSRSMLDRAREKSIAHPGVTFRQGSAEAIPLDDGSADVVFLSMVLHHLQDRACAANECRRILRAGGRVLVRSSTRDTDYPQGRFFPGMQTMIARELPSRDEVISMFETVGLELCAYQLVMHPVAASWHDLADKLAMRADSFLARLPDADFAAGLAALRAHAASRQLDEPVTEEISFFVFRG